MSFVVGTSDGGRRVDCYAEPGKATLYVTAKGGMVASDLAMLFDLTNVDIDFDFKVIDKPIRTFSGKFKLKV